MNNNKYFSPELAQTTGHEGGLRIAKIGAECGAEIGAINAIRKAQGKPSLEECEAAFWQEMRDYIAKYGEEGLDPINVATALGRPITDEMWEESVRKHGF